MLRSSLFFLLAVLLFLAGPQAFGQKAASSSSAVQMNVPPGGEDPSDARAIERRSTMLPSNKSFSGKLVSFTKVGARDYDLALEDADGKVVHFRSFAVDLEKNTSQKPDENIHITYAEKLSEDGSVARFVRAYDFTVQEEDERSSDF